MEREALVVNEPLTRRKEPAEIMSRVSIQATNQLESINQSINALLCV